jgi:hypothetical protein
LHSCLDEFVDLATALVSRSPINPVPIQLTPGNIIGDIKWNPGATG